MRVAVIGVGQSKFGQRKDASIRELAYEAAQAALDDCNGNVGISDIEAVVSGIASDHFAQQLQPGALLSDYLGIAPKPNFRVEAACATGSAALRTGLMAIKSGMHDLILVIGAEKMTEVDTPTAVGFIGRGGDVQWESPFGTTFPGNYAMIARAHMARYKTTKEDLAKIAVKNHFYGAKNPYAQFQKEITLEKALTAPMISSPLGLYDCSPLTDGAAAAILVAEERAKSLTDTPIWVDASSVATDTMSLLDRKNLTELSSVQEAARKAYDQAKVHPTKDIDVACVHDCFTIAEILAYEDLGFCAPGAGKELIEDAYIGGRIPVNVDGGLKAKGHPLGATGLAMLKEITIQLRGEAEAGRQANGAEVGLMHNVGGTGHYAFIHVLRRQ
ncbi:MAG: thiolase domain-containing protein [Candidatus Heimdallarchaeota archaeon]